MIHKQLKYGRIERERTFLLDRVPGGEPDRSVEIVDRYIQGSRLRLRWMRWSDGRIEHKLARKLPEHAPGTLVMGNLYLSATEHALMTTLPADELRKWRIYYGGWGVDVFEGALSGLILAEKEEDDLKKLARMTPPFPFVRDVTGDHRYMGGHLAANGFTP
ncbi:MAG: hypothetical protein AAFV53_25625 [Myxococcota bacterium]